MRQQWADAQIREWYLFPETLPTSLDPAAYGTVDAYVDALTATARGQGRDRYFTYLTSIAEETAYYEAGASVGFGFRLGIGTDGTRDIVVVIEAFEGAAALSAGIDRGWEILAIGTSSSNLRNITDIMREQDGMVRALGPDTAGTARVFRVKNLVTQQERVVTLTKRDFPLQPVSSRYGAKIIDDGGRKVGYVNLRTFISTAEQPLRDAFDNFRAQGVTEVIVDLRYNGGGLLSTAELLGDLLGGNRFTSDVFSYTNFRSEKSSFNLTRNFTPQPQSMSPMRIAFIGTGSTASASELVMNAFIPYLQGDVALVGTNTYGKPVGQIALDKAECDDRLRLVAFSVQNSAHSDAYYNGLASTMQPFCGAVDDYAHPLGDPQEESIKQALGFLRTGTCTSTSARSLRRAEVPVPQQRLLIPERPNTIQREVPGAF